MNKNELEAAMARSGKSRTEIAEALGISIQTLWNKVEGRCEFKVSEIQSLITTLGLNMNDVLLIFFSQTA